MIGYVYSPIMDDKNDYLSIQITKEEAAQITGCKNLPDDVDFWTCLLKTVVMFEYEENSSKVQIRIDNLGVGTKRFIDSGCFSDMFSASKIYG